MEPEEVLESPEVLEETDEVVEDVAQAEDSSDPVVETPAPANISRPEIIINTGGLWKKFEEIVSRELEAGKTYNITFGSKCEVMISDTKPANGIITTEIVYTKHPDKYLWIKTGA